MFFLLFFFYIESDLALYHLHANGATSIMVVDARDQPTTLIMLTEGLPRTPSGVLMTNGGCRTERIKKVNAPTTALSKK